jgi:hypothetical protein
MTKAEKARQAAIERVGDAYVYGAWDQFCTPRNRNKYADLNDTYASAIIGQCQRQSGKKSNCEGCKYNGHRIHDCRGLTSACAKAAGIETITGQTVAKQWNAMTWARKGTIDTLPQELPYAQLFRKSNEKWQHTGCYIGNGETVDARGHTKGVIRGKLSAYPWTHWALPEGMEEETSSVGSADTFPKGEGSEGGDRVIYAARVNTPNGGRLNIRCGPGLSYRKIGALLNGEKFDVHAEYDTDGDGAPDWAFVAGDGMQGYVYFPYIAPIDRPGSAQDAPQELEGETPAEPPAEDPGPQPAARWGVWIACDSEEEARRYAGDIKGAVVFQYEEKPPGKGGEGE